MPSVPTANDVKNSGKDSVGALPAAAGSAFGRMTLGRGLGTAAGGILGASTQSGEERTRMAQMSAYTAVQEITQPSPSGSSGGRGRM